MITEAALTRSEVDAPLCWYDETTTTVRCVSPWLDKILSRIPVRSGQEVALQAQALRLMQMAADAFSVNDRIPLDTLVVKLLDALIAAETSNKVESAAQRHGISASVLKVHLALKAELPTYLARLQTNKEQS